MNSRDGFIDLQSHRSLSKLSDERLVAIAQAGSPSAFGELFTRHQKTLSRTVERITRNAHDTEDVLQDCSIRAFLHIKSFNGKSAYSTWLVRIAINTALMMLRNRRRATVTSLDEYVDAHHHSPWEVAEPSYDPEHELLEQEMQFQIHQAVSQLPASLRIVLDAKRFQDTPLKELASMTGLTVAATKSRLYRARRALRSSVRRMQRQPFKTIH